MFDKQILALKNFVLESHFSEKMIFFDQMILFSTQGEFRMITDQKTSYQVQKFWKSQNMSH